jgi:hypothetical protein
VRWQVFRINVLYLLEKAGFPAFRKGNLMRKISGLTLLAAFCAVSLRGQTAVPSPGRAPGRTGPRESIDNPLVHVFEATLQPHQPGPPQEHTLNRVFVFRDAGQITWKTGGTVQTFDFKAGDIRWDPAGTPVITENISDHPIQLVEIDLKNKPADPPLVLTNLDMLVADPEHYKFVFENDQVRVLRVQYQPHEKGGLHQHARGRVIVNLTDNLRTAYGDVNWNEPETHQETNNFDSPVDRIVIEAK